MDEVSGIEIDVITHYCGDIFLFLYFDLFDGCAWGGRGMIIRNEAIILIVLLSFPFVATLDCPISRY